MLGVYKFNLDTTSLHEKANRTEIEVYFDVEIDFDKNTREITHTIKEILSCSVYIGGKIIVDDFKFSELAESTQGLIKLQMIGLDLSDLDIDEEEARAELVESEVE